MSNLSARNNLHSMW